MKRIDEDRLPNTLSAFDAVWAAYPGELARVCKALQRRLPTLVECDKELTPYFYRAVRDRLKASGTPTVYLDGRPAPDAPPNAPKSMVAVLLGQLRDAVRGAVGDRVVVLPHLDLVATSSAVGLTSEGREVIALLYENPNIVWLGFKDPSFMLPRVIDNLFPQRESILGIGRDRLGHLVTQKEARKLGRGLDPYQLYKYVSGTNAVRLRRLMGSLEGEDYPLDPEPVLAQLRNATIGAELSLPDLDLEGDIGGYDGVKKRLTEEILSVLARKDSADDAATIKRLEGLIPRGMIFWGPPGTGKTLFAKAMASALGAAITVVSGPELKSRWVGESEERIRQVFVRARQSAPAVIVFDELDSFATARGTYTGSGVEHSMVNQLLTEMDGFRKDELVFVVGTTNFVESLDPALLRPGRFEFQLAIPYPNADDRAAIFDIYDRKLELRLSDRAKDYAVKRTADPVHVGGNHGHYTGDHIQALCRAIARGRLRDGTEDQPTELEHVEAAITRYLARPELTGAEERIVAAHESGHAIVALNCESAPPIERISIQGDIGGALGFVRYADPAHRHVVSRNQLLDSICMLFGGREAEALICDDVSIGATADIARASEIAFALVADYGMGDEAVGVRRLSAEPNHPIALSEKTRAAVDDNVRRILDGERERARRILEENRASLTTLRDLLIEHKVLDREAIAHLMAKDGSDG